MAKSRSLQQAVRFALAAVSAAAGVSTVSGQEAPPAPPAEAQAQANAAPLQEVVVTGSRLMNPNSTSISPITTVSATDIQATGLTRVEDILNNLPMVFAGENTTTSNGADGTATIDLRNLGNTRTLVLVDGLRLGPGAGDGRNYSDINEIPASLISSVQILTGGASSVYGADAVAGVVNFILNTHFEGVRIDAGYNFFQHSQDNPNGVQQAVNAAAFTPAPGSVDTGFGKNVSILVGSNFADNKGNATAYLTYDNTGPVLQSNYDYSACSLTAGVGALACGGSGTSAKNGAGGEFLGYSKSGVKFLDNTVDGKTNVFRPFAAPGDLFNYGPYNYYQTPETRWTAGTFLNYEVNSHATVYASVMFMRNEQLAQIAPSGDFGNPTFIACADPLLNASEASVFCNTANQALEGNPTEIYNGKTYPGLNVYILRRNVEGGPRIADFISTSAREVFGVKGDINDEWTYDISMRHSEVDGAQSNLNFLANSNIQQALNVLPGPTGPVCGGPNNPLGIGPLVTPGTAFSPNSSCVPWNIWASKGVTAAQLAYLSVPEQLQDTTQEYNAIGSITGDLGKYGVKLPFADDGLQVNVGAEWREDEAAFNPDYVSQQGLAAGGGGATPPISGEFSVSEAFTELRLPLAQHQPWAEDLAVETGYRYSSYTLGFNTSTYKVGLEWAPTSDVRFRGSYQRAVRAPNITELYLPQSVALDGSEDPCTGPTPAGSLAGCEASGLTKAEYGHLNPNPASQYNGLAGGNPNLEPEIADTYSVGLVLTPRIVPNLQFSVDYFDISIKDVIETLGGNTIINGCVFEGQFCNLVHRDPANGSLWLSTLGYVTDTFINEGKLGERGFDIKGSYRQPLPALGSLLFGLDATYLESLATTPVAGQGSYDCAGYYGDVCGGEDNKIRGVLNVTWSTPWDALDLTLRWRYFSGQTTEQLNASKYLAGTSFFPPLAHIPAYSYLDLSATFNVYKNVRLELGVNNVFDKDPPIVTLADCSTGSIAGANCNGNTFPGVYDAMGRYLFAHITAQF
ncbi:MAG TPA: TonB-dependent receptor [Steroidobacteraceae bacterium]|nr:TonB-dependent receptor [Steroidobacteraceae bacterium]